MSGALKKVSLPTEAVPPSTPVEQLKVEQTTLSAEIDKAKSQAVRQQDESTRVFNLRQAQLVQRIRDLEMRKMRTEREINSIMTQKNTSLHDDLKKATQVLVNETLKLAPLEKEIESGMTKISNLKSEMQALFETSMDERKKHHHVLVSQSKEVQALTELVKACTSTITQEYRKLTSSVEPLLKQKVELTASLNSLKEECALTEVKLKALQTKHMELDRSCIEKSDTLKALQEKTEGLKEVETRVRELSESLVDLTAQKLQLQQSIERADATLTELNQSGRRLETSITFLHEQYERKKEMVAGADKEVHELRNRVELLKNQELNLIQTSSNYQGMINQLQHEIASFEALKQAAVKLHEESQEFYNERRQHYHQECRVLEDNFKLRSTQMDSDLDAKKQAWEHGFKQFTESREKQLREKLERIQLEHEIYWTERRNTFIARIQEILDKQINQQTFASQDQKLEAMKPEIEELFKQFFSQKPQKKWWKFW